VHCLLALRARTVYALCQVLGPGQVRGFASESGDGKRRGGGGGKLPTSVPVGEADRVSGYAQCVCLRDPCAGVEGRGSGTPPLPRRVQRARCVCGRSRSID
jgi:hypothetical protein